LRFAQGFDTDEQYNKIVEQARGEGGQGGQGGNGGIVEASYGLLTGGDGYAFKDGFGMVMGEGVEGFDGRNFRTGMACDSELVFPKDGKARVAMEEQFERECKEQYAGGGQAGGGMAAGGGGGIKERLEAVAAGSDPKKKEPARVGDLISVSDFSFCEFLFLLSLWFRC
jgi:hypothetical protein